MIAICAMSQNFVIGKNGKIPWSISEDLKFFRKQTLDKSILIGRVTFETLPFLPRRKIYVLGKETNNPSYNMDDVAFLSHYDEAPEDIIVAGGGKIYESLLPLCDELILTIVDKDYEGDTYFPDYTKYFNRKQILFSGYDAGEETTYSMWRLINKNK